MRAVPLLTAALLASSLLFACASTRAADPLATLAGPLDDSEREVCQPVPDGSRDGERLCTQNETGVVTVRREVWGRLLDLERMWVSPDSARWEVLRDSVESALRAEYGPGRRCGPAHPGGRDLSLWQLPTHEVAVTAWQGPHANVVFLRASREERSDCPPYGPARP